MAQYAAAEDASSSDEDEGGDECQTAATAAAAAAAARGAQGEAGAEGSQAASSPSAATMGAAVGAAGAVAGGAPTSPDASAAAGRAAAGEPTGGGGASAFRLAIDQVSALPLPTPAGEKWEVVGSDGRPGAAAVWCAAVSGGGLPVVQPPVSWLQDETHLSLVLQARPAGDESLAVVWYARPGDGEDADGDRLASAVDVVFLAGSDGPTSSAAWAAQLEEAASSRNAAARGRAAEATRASSPVLVGGLVPEEGAGGVLGVAASGAPADSAAPGVSGTRGAAGGAAIAYWLRLVLPAPVRPAGSSADAASLNACLVARKDTDAIWPGPVDEAAATELAGWHAQWASPAELVGLAGEVAAATAASGAEAAAAASPASEPARMPDKAAPGTAPHQGTTGDGGKVAQSQPAAEPTLAAASPSPTGVGARRPGAPKPTAAAKALMFELD